MNVTNRLTAFFIEIILCFKIRSTESENISLLVEKHIT